MVYLACWWPQCLAKEIGPNMHCVNLDVIRPRWDSGEGLTVFFFLGKCWEEFHFFVVGFFC